MAVRGASGARRIELNRKAFDAITLAVADGAFALAVSIVEGADVPDAPPYGQGLVEGGGVVAFVGRKRVAVSRPGVKKPRACRLTPFGITVAGGYGFPGKYQEQGTVHQSPQPFLTPALMEGLPGAEGFIKLACKKAGVIGVKRAAVRASG
jgi:hypothetical protein